MSFQVVAPLVLARDQGGHTHHIYRNDVIPWLSDAQREHFLAEGLVVEVDDAADEPADGDDADEVPDTSWRRDEIDAWAAALDPPLDTAFAANKADALALIDEHLAEG